MTAAARPRKVVKRFGSPRSVMLAAVLTVLLTAGLGSIARAAAAERVVTDRHTGLAIYGIDPVAFYTKRKPTEGRGEFELRHAGAIWRFENEGNRAAFIMDPAIYMPRYGGYDPIGIARAVATPGYAALWSVVENRLYLFYTAEAQKIFLADPHAAIAAADARWPEVMKDLPE
jgi:hypothetical protein